MLNFRRCILLSFLILFGVSHAETIYVSGTGASCNLTSAYSTIQEAVGAAADGDTIIICSDIEYVENVMINKSVNVYGNDSSDKAVVSADIASAPVFTIDADHVNISNFILKDATGSYGLYSVASHGSIDNVTATNNDIGFYLETSSHNNLTSNIAHDNFDEGFRLSSNSNNNTLVDNTAYNQLYYGFYIHESSGNRLISNTAYNSSSWYGFFLHSGARENTLLNNTAYGNTHHGFHVYQTSDNTLTGNIAYNNSVEGFRLSSSSNNHLTGNIAYDNLHNGFLLTSGTGNILTNNSAYNNSQYGFYVHLSTGNQLLSNTASLQEDGFHVFSGSNNQLTSNTAYENDNGFYLDLSSNNNLSSNIAYENLEHGFLFSSSSGNRISDNVAHGNLDYGFYGYLSSDNDLDGNTAYENLHGFRISSSSNNQITGNTAHSNSNNGIYLYLSSGNLLESNTVNDNSYHGFFLYESHDNVIVGNTARDNDRNGIYLYLGSNNSLTNNTARDNQHHGIMLSSCSETTLTGNDVHDNSLHGLYVYLSPDSRLSANTVYSNSLMGTHLYESTGSILQDEHYYNNDVDFKANASLSMTMAISGLIIDNPSGNLEDYSNISIVDAIEPDSAYLITWASQPGSLPHPLISFEDKYLDITSTHGSVSIDSLTWHWLDSEAGGYYRESEFQAWQHDGSGWAKLDGVLDVNANTLTVSNLDPASIYGILQNRSVPGVFLVYPPPGGMVNTTELNLSWIVYSYDDTVLCDITVNDNIINGFSITTASGVTTNYTVDMPESSYSWNVTCQDSIGTNTSETRNFTIDLPPSVNIIPPDSDYTNDTESEVDFIVEDNTSSTLNCSLYIDGTLNQTNGTVANSTPTSFLIVGLAEGNHTVQVSCEDDAGNVDTSEVEDIIVDLTPPQIELISPENDYLGSDTIVTFNFNATDELSPEITSSLYIDGDLVQTTTSDHFTVPVSEGAHNWSIVSVDLAGNANTSEVRDFTLDQTAPAIVLHEPPNRRRITSSEPVDVTFSFSATDNHATTVDCTFYLDGSANYTNGSVQDGVPVSFSRTLDLGTHDWRVVCSDDVNNTGTTPYRTITIGTGSNDDDDDDDDPDPSITIAFAQNCPEGTVTFNVSSGSGTLLRILDSDNLLAGRNTTNSSGQATFNLTGQGLYEAIATKTSYRRSSMTFFHTMCNTSDTEPNEDDDSDDNEDEESDQDNQEQESGDGGTGEEQDDQGGGSGGDAAPLVPQVDIIVDEIAYQGDTLSIQVYVNDEGASVRLQVTSPENNKNVIVTDVYGKASFKVDEVGQYGISVIDPYLPRKTASVNVIERNIDDIAKPTVYTLLACIPSFILLALFLGVSYFTIQRRKRDHGRGYMGFRESRARREEGRIAKMKRLIMDEFS